MRLLHTADVHLELASYGRSVEEFGTTFRLFAETAIAEKVDVAVVAGDLFHSRRPGPLAIALAVRPIRMLIDAGIQVVIGPGNHDGMGTIAAPDTHTLAWMKELDLTGIEVATVPTVFELDVGTFAVLPYAHKRAVEQTGTLAERTAEASRILEQTIADMASRRPPVRRGKRRTALPFVFVGHLTTLGASLGAEGAMQMGWDTTVDPVVFDAFDYAALGHIHVGQRVTSKAWYAGSPDVHAFGERAEDKRFLLVDVRARQEPVVTAVPTKTRPFLSVSPPASADVAGAIVELVYDVPQEPKAVEEAVRSMKEAGAFFVRVKLPAPDRRRLASEVSLDRLELPEQMAVWLREHGHDPDEYLDVALEVVRSFGTE